MKIIQLGSFPLNSSQIKGGVEASVYGLALEQNKNHKVIVFDFPRHEITIDKYEVIDGINVRRFRNFKNSNISSVRRISKYITDIQEFKPDICHIHTSSLFALVLFLALKIKKLPTIVTVHGLAHIEKQIIWRKKKNLKNLSKYLLQSIAEFLLLNITKQIIVDTEYVSEVIKTYKKQGKILRAPICHIIPQGVSSQFFALNDASIKNQLLSVGSISQRKGHLLLIEALSIISKKIPDVKLSIVGALSDQNYLNLLNKMIDVKGLRDKIQIQPNLSIDKVLSLYEKAEIFALHSEEESQGIVFCEAMAAGKPIVATNVGGVPNVITNEVNGLLCNFGDITNFANNIILLLENDAMLVKIANTNKIDRNKYKWNLIEERISSLYNSILNKK